MKINIGNSLDNNSSWSFDGVCKVCNENLSSCKCDTKKDLLLPEKHFLIFKKEVRRGKVVTIVGEFFIKESECKDLLTKLKKHLGCGGTIKDNFLEFQGEVKEKIKVYLLQQKFRFKN